MSPSSSSSASSATSLNQIGGPQSNASTTSCSSSSSSTNAKSSNKQRRQTIAALAAAAAAAGSQNTNPQAPIQTNNQMQSDLQRNLVALASQFGIKTESANFDQMLQDINADKNKLLSTLTPNPMNRKQIKNKKAHLLSASANTTPTNMNTLPIINGKQKVKKKSINGGAHFQDSSNLQNQAAAAAAAAALQSYQQLINNTLAKQSGGSPNKYRGNGYYNPDDPEDENNRQYDDDEEDYDMKGGENSYNQTGGPGIKSLSTTPLTQNNTNQTGPVMTPNLEFECTACEKKFKYYCYYKRHMDACHSEWPKYVCETCNKSYKWEASYRQHLRSHHGIMGPTTNGSEPNMNNGASGEMNSNNGNNNGYNSEDEMMDEQNGGYDNEINTSQKDQAYNENLDEEDDIDSQEQDIEQQINQSQNEQQQKSYDNEQIGAAGALASIADSINSSNAASGVLVGNRD